MTRANENCDACLSMFYLSCLKKIELRYNCGMQCGGFRFVVPGSG